MFVISILSFYLNYIFIFTKASTNAKIYMLKSINSFTGLFDDGAAENEDITLKFCTNASIQSLKGVHRLGSSPVGIREPPILILSNPVQFSKIHLLIGN